MFSAAEGGSGKELNAGAELTVSRTLGGEDADIKGSRTRVCIPAALIPVGDLIYGILLLILFENLEKSDLSVE